MATDTHRKVKIIVLGDSGVGKTSLVHLITQGEVLTNPVTTVGCSVEVKLHEYTRSLSSTPVSFFVEVWDLDGNVSHRKGRGIFYQQANGVILVHDLTNRKSHANLSSWLSEFHSSRNGHYEHTSDADKESYDPEKFVEQELPILIVGTKEDQVSGRRSPPTLRGSHVLGANSISVNSRSPQQFNVASQQYVELMKFFDKVIEHKYYPSLRPVSQFLAPFYIVTFSRLVPLVLYNIVLPLVKDNHLIH